MIDLLQAIPHIATFLWGVFLITVALGWWHG